MGASRESEQRQSNPPDRIRAGAILFPALLFLLNAVICSRLFGCEYLDQLQSIAGEFIALARYIQRHHPFYDWFPLWRAGMPFSYVYQPGLHYLVAATASAFHSSPAAAYNIVTGITYSLGAAACFLLAHSLSKDIGASFSAGLLFSLWSPSLLFLRDARLDAGTLWNARRLQALVVYGEGPNVTGLTLCMLALALLHYAVARRTATSAVAASLALAAVSATSWPASVALTLGVLCYIAALQCSELGRALPRMAILGALAYAFASPFALPSTIRTTFSNTNVMSEAPSRGAGFWVSGMLLIFALGIARAASRQASLALRFSVLYSVVVGWVVLSDNWFGIRLISNPERFHLAMEIGLVLTVAFAMHRIASSSPTLVWSFRLILFFFCVYQVRHYSDYAKQIIRPIEMTQTLEYQVAQWAAQNLHGERMETTGTVSYWMDVFSETPHLDGCCLQSIINPNVLTADYIIPAGYGSDVEAADYSLLWMKAFAVHAIAMGGPKTRDGYHDFRFPYRFRDRLPLLWQSGDDYIYKVPERVPGLARVVRADGLVRTPPVNGIDVTELRPFVAALDDPALPVVETTWSSPGAAAISGSLQPDHVLSVAINFEPRWHASANGREIPVRKDGLGLIVIEPHCSGSCNVSLHWDAGWEPRIALAAACFALLCGAIWIYVEASRKSRNPQ